MSAALGRKQNRRKNICKELDFNLKECKGAINGPNCTRVVLIREKVIWTEPLIISMRLMIKY